MRSYYLKASWMMLVGILFIAQSSFAVTCRMSGRAANYQILANAEARTPDELKQFERQCFDLNGHISLGSNIGMSCSGNPNLTYCYNYHEQEVFCTGVGSDRTSAIDNARKNCESQFPAYPSGDCQTQSAYYSFFSGTNYECQD